MSIGFYKIFHLPTEWYLFYIKNNPVAHSFEVEANNEREAIEEAGSLYAEKHHDGSQFCEVKELISA